MFAILVSFAIYVSLFWIIQKCEDKKNINYFKNKYGILEEELMSSIGYLKAQGKLKSDTFLDFKLTQSGLNTVKRARGI